MEKKDYIQKLSDAVLEMLDDEVVALSEAYIREGYPALEGIMQGLVDGMHRATELFEQEEYFIPEILLCSDTMNAGLAILRPHIPQSELGVKVRIVIGVVQGDSHDIGKNLVKIMLETAGYEVYDLGKDVLLQQFVDKAIEFNADIVAISTLMSTTMREMQQVIRLLHDAGIRDRVKVIVGGAPVSQQFAQRIGADGYSATAFEAVKLVQHLVGKG